MGSEQKMIASLEANIEKLLERYEFLQKENDILANRNFLLQQENKSQKDEISFYHEQLQTLKIAKTLEGSEGYKRDTRAKIDFLIAEIDHCIKELNT
ncbi:hypothetical protein [Wenyingzhuangia sp. 2_MG-2023]|uniref:hypothetical protein n=1 Tax=Wenyingzhuangia sp. 2_MG-2023 TaxID=3062639 RepID=UPI0026E3E3B7|nr:hypothetical protein [Wenyingzhuangia sp. 2_MG-2023]MDO6738971.1 hypothetical protein [Wenyingzhuangia sp. 2_MG-2023]MDO6803726.1 hypothetical protein [Wenyingzhuangia sp. 1_MG-2023]